MPDTFQYECSRGHFIESAKPVNRCPMCRHGKPCTGTLKAVGDGSRAENQRLQEANR